ncbi:hypothetical protein H4683_000934 [Filibacter limicola]|uniref:Uncharacterized protein n=1 Tax=Sporosarcina limicola TaxID=34101 RepID=A0A927RBZ1_9BACL|nr:hypothetical protein [Sporosarcina limicola]
MNFASYINAIDGPTVITAEVLILKISTLYNYSKVYHEKGLDGLYRGAKLIHTLDYATGEAFCVQEDTIRP